jgi:hypothetical protein
MWQRPRTKHRETSLGEKFVTIIAVALFILLLILILTLYGLIPSNLRPQ